MDILEAFKKYDDEYMKFKDCTEKLSSRADICAFLIADRLVPGDSDMISNAEHDQIFLVVDLVRLEEIATDEDVANLVRCGVFIDEDSLSMFV